MPAKKKKTKTYALTFVGFCAIVALISHSTGILERFTNLFKASPATEVDTINSTNNLGTIQQIEINGTNNRTVIGNSNGVDQSTGKISIDQSNSENARATIVNAPGNQAPINITQSDTYVVGRVLTAEQQLVISNKLARFKGTNVHQRIFISQMVGDPYSEELAALVKTFLNGTDWSFGMGLSGNDRGETKLYFRALSDSGAPPGMGRTDMTAYERALVAALKEAKIIREPLAMPGAELDRLGSTNSNSVLWIGIQPAIR